MSLLELLEQLIADVADTNNNTANNDENENGNDSVLITTVEERQQRRLIVVESLLRKDLLPLRQRIKIGDLVDDYHVHDMITDQRYGEQYEGLDSDRDTIEEVTSILRLVPEVLQRRKEMQWLWFENDEENEDDDDDENVVGEWIEVDNYDTDEYPIQCLLYRLTDEGGARFNTKAIPFLHLFAQLALEYNSFDDDARGGLMIRDEYDSSTNVMENLVDNAFLIGLSEDICRHVDEIRTNEFIQLRQMNLLTYEDIREVPLFSMLCNSSQRIFPHNSIRFFIEWSPTLLLLPCVSVFSNGFLPLHSAVKTHSISNFRFIFEYMIRYFPYKKGITCLFRSYRRDGVVITPFSLACDIFDRPQVMEVVEDALAQVSLTTPINTVEAVVLAATDPNIQLDCLYFLIQRRPDVLLSSSGNSSRTLVPSSRSTVNSSVVHDDDDDDDDSEDNIEGDGNNGGLENYHTKKTNHRDDDDDHANTDTDTTATTTSTTLTTTLKRKRSK